MAEKLNADLNIIQRSGIEIAVEPITADLNIIQKLDDEPNDVGGLSAADLKAKFDEAGNTIKTYINESLIPQVVGADATEAERAAAEVQREANETAREQAEASRDASEAQRQESETARVQAETARETAFDEAQAERAAEFSQAQAQQAAVFSAGEEARNFWEDYDPTKSYVPGNKVYYLGSSYVNKVPCRNVLPTVADNWQMIAKKGADSDEGLSQEEADLRYLQLDGGKMTGAMEVLPPEEDLQPATKAYADDRETAANEYTDNVRTGMLDNDVFSRPQTLTAATAARYGLPATAVPDDVFNAILPETGSISHIISGSYVGTGVSTHTIHVGFSPKILLIAEYTIYSFALDVGIFIDNCRGLKLYWRDGKLSSAVVPVDWSSGSGITIGDASANIFFNSSGAAYNFVALA